MSIFDSMENQDRRRSAWQKKAQELFLPGIDPADLKKGMRVTISPNLRYEDNSYTDKIHTVLAVNSAQVMTKIDNHWSDKPVMLLVCDHHFYSADEFDLAMALENSNERS
jgi:hypothetical protein